MLKLALLPDSTTGFNIVGNLGEGKTELLGVGPLFEVVGIEWKLLNPGEP